MLDLMTKEGGTYHSCRLAAFFRVHSPGAVKLLAYRWRLRSPVAARASTASGGYVWALTCARRQNRSVEMVRFRAMVVALADETVDCEGYSPNHDGDRR